MGRSALQEKKDDRFVADGLALGEGLGFGFEKTGESEAAQSQTAEGSGFEKVTTTQALAGLIWLMVG
jgi:hypothetical protein